MENAPSKYTVSFGLSFALASVVNALLVVAKEKSHSVQNWMQHLTGHQWITHAGIIILLFVASGWLLAQMNGGQGPKLAAKRLPGVILAGVAAGYVIIVGFYLIAD